MLVITYKTYDVNSLIQTDKRTSSNHIKYYYKKANIPDQSVECVCDFVSDQWIHDVFLWVQIFKKCVYFLFLTGIIGNLSLSR